MSAHYTILIWRNTLFRWMRYLVIGLRVLCAIIRTRVCCSTMSRAGHHSSFLRGMSVLAKPSLPRRLGIQLHVRKASRSRYTR